jgi:chromosomal replication initiation ATPase DnaA
MSLIEVNLDVLEERRQMSLALDVDLPGAELAQAAIERVAYRHAMTVDDLRSRSKSSPLVAVRQEAMHAARTEAKATYEVIGQLLDRDHSTVVTGIRSHLARAEAAA